MRISYHWLSTYIQDLPAPQKIADTLTSIGLEVEDILSFDYLDNFQVAQIVEAKKHPNADSLSLCTVQTGSETLQIVCGAPNVRDGLFVALAPIGVTMPNGMKIKKSKIRGEYSEGMMCSKDELALSSRSSRGIMELEEHPLGTSLKDALSMDDVIFDISVTPNRSDCFSVQGVARDLAAKLRLPFKPSPPLPVSKPSFTSNISLTCSPKAHKACPLFLTRVIRGVTNKPSPAWLSKRLREAGGSPISALVDITNFFLFDAGRPLHVFDLKALKQESLHIDLSQQGEKFTGLDDKEHSLPQDAIVLKDGSGAIVSLAGIMGSKDSGSYEHTSDIVLEAAAFDPFYISKTGQNTFIHTEARSRFERGVDAARTRELFEQATSLIISICGGEAGSIVEHNTLETQDTEIIFSEKDYTQFMGATLPQDTEDILTSLGYVSSQKNSWKVPSWRHDVKIPQDMFTDIWRMSPHDSIPLTPLPTTQWPQNSFEDQAISIMRRTMQSLGYNETIPFMMISPTLYKTFGGSDKTSDISNPISQELSYIRQNLASTMTLSVKQNIDYKIYPVQLYELGPVYEQPTPDHRELRIGGVCCGPFHAHSWDNTTQSASTLTCKKHITTILEALQLDPSKLEIKQENPPAYTHPAQSGDLFYDNEHIGVIGSIHPNVVSSLMKTQEPICFFELRCKPLVKAALNASQSWQPSALSPFHDVHRDLAFFIEESAPVQDILKEARTVAGPHLKDISVFDYFQGNDVPEGQVSLGIHLVYNNPDAQITDDTISASWKKIINTLSTKFNAQLRQ